MRKIASMCFGVVTALIAITLLVDTPAAANGVLSFLEELTEDHKTIRRPMGRLALFGAIAIIWWLASMAYKKWRANIRK